MEDAKKMVVPAPEDEAEAGVELESEEGGSGTDGNAWNGRLFYGKHAG